jgi:DNA-binding response OmpR family regulator
MKKLLIVEDEKSLAAAYQMILQQHGYEVTVAYDGEEALALVKKGTFDLILLDMNMPKMNGLEMLRELEAAKLQNRVIIFSNQDSEADIEEAFRLGAKRYLLKSWASPQDLVRIVEEGLES